jgi:ABC-2 type transport system permease protein
MRTLVYEFVIQSKLYLRHRETVFWNFLFPVFMMLLFGSIFGGDGGIRIRVGIVDLDQGYASQQFIEGLERAEVLQLTVGEEDSLMQDLRENRKTLVIRFPQGFTEQVMAGDASFQVYYDATDPQYSQIALSVIDQAVSIANRMVTGQSGPFSYTSESIEAESRELRYIDFFVPGLVVMTLMSTTFFSVGVVISSYREKKVLRRLQVTPLRRWVFFSAQVTSRTIFILIQTLWLIGLGLLIFKLHLSGSLIGSLAVLILGSLTFLAMGFMIAGLARNTDTAVAVANVLFFPMMFLSGVWFPLEMMPDFLRPVINVLPSTFLVNGLRAVMTGGKGIADVGQHLAVLGAWLVVCSALSIKTFRYE